MSRECCGPDGPVSIGTRPGQTLLPVTSSPRAAGPVTETAPFSPPVSDTGEEAEEFTPWWKDQHLLVPIAAGLLLGVGYVLARAELHARTGSLIML